MITLFHWDCSAKTCRTAAAEALPQSAASISGEDVWWIDLSNPTPEEEAAVFSRFLPVHSLTLEDITRSRREPNRGAHFPKVEEFPDYLFVIVNPLSPELADFASTEQTKPDSAPPFESATSRLTRKFRPQLSAIITENVLITHHVQPLPCVETVQAHVERHADAAGRGPDYLLHLILDAMVDEYAPVVDRVASRLDRIEALVFTNPSRVLLANMLRLKRVVSGMRKTLILEREVLARLMRGEFKLVSTREIAYYRNVYDHVARYTELIEAAREMVSDLMESHLAAASYRLNEAMKVLTMISTAVLPMTLVAGVYGMNFKHIPELEWLYGYPFALGLMALTAIASLILFKWKRWI